ncbi:hypothetical protein L914_09123 [Phytophthora nicotianae]|uniref:RxLR effector protein n=1 Tax=Phytophthora nicotianae TaxID=4792 RepID=W2NDF4_PHYNI|nr:hypothetical protein L914_09123 [Phytophthora nicotianae]
MRLSSFLVVVVAATLTVSFSNVTYAKEEVKITQLDYVVQGAVGKLNPSSEGQPVLKRPKVTLSSFEKPPNLNQLL